MLGLGVEGAGVAARREKMASATEDKGDAGLGGGRAGEQAYRKSRTRPREKITIASA